MIEVLGNQLTIKMDTLSCGHLIIICDLHCQLQQSKVNEEVTIWPRDTVIMHELSIDSNRGRQNWCNKTVWSRDISSYNDIDQQKSSWPQLPLVREDLNWGKQTFATICFGESSKLR